MYRGSGARHWRAEQSKTVTQPYEKQWEMFGQKEGPIRVSDVPFPAPRELAAAAHNKTEYKKQVYFALCEPDGDATQVLRWHPDKWLQRYKHR